MSYTIQYNPELKKKYPKKIKYNQLSSKNVLILIVIFVSAYIFAHNGWLNFLLPGDTAVTSAALSQLIEGVGEGRPIKEAVYSFCEEVIIGGIN